MKTVRWNGAVVTEDRVIPDGAVIFSADKILWVGKEKEVPAQWAALDNSVAANTKYILPGLVDIHSHGGGGASFPDATSLEELRVAANEHLRYGTTTIVASLVTAALDVLCQRANLLSEGVKNGIIKGIHFEGPFLSEARCGAQDPRFLIDPTVAAVNDLVRAAGGNALTMTIAPERFSSKTGYKSLEALIKSGVIPSWGHTDADLTITEDEIAAGTVLMDRFPRPGLNRATVTHLFNGMRPLHHRDPGPIAQFLASAKSERVVVEIICDGVHVDPLLVRNVIETVGRDNCVFVTDSMAAAGMPDGNYSLGPQKVTVQNGIARLSEGNSLAGGSSHLLDCIKIAVNDAGLSVEDATFLASTQGARIFGWDDLGSLAPGKKSDLVSVDEQFRPTRVVKNGAAC